MKFSHYKQNVHKSSQLSRYHVLTGLQWYCSDPSLLAGEGDMLLPGFFFLRVDFPSVSKKQLRRQTVRARD